MATERTPIRFTTDTPSGFRTAAIELVRDISPEAFFTRATSNTDEDQALYEQHDKLVSHDFTGNHWPGPWG